ncbi:MAG: hypothetical protein ACK57K_14205 [Chryseotalea sp.]
MCNINALLLSFLCVCFYQPNFAETAFSAYAKPDTIAIKLKNKETEALVRNLLKECKPGTIPYIIQQTFGSSTEIHLSINDFLQLPDSIMAIAIEGNVNRDKYVSSILVNKEALQFSTDAYLASVFLHEFLHIYLKLTRPNTLFNDHEEMANDHLKLLENSLKVAFPNLSQLEREALSWGGLHATSAWKTLVQINRKKAVYMFGFCERERVTLLPKENQTLAMAAQ